jgi:hypothetical protein
MCRGYDQAVHGGTGANHIMLGTGDAIMTWSARHFCCRRERGFQFIPRNQGIFAHGNYAGDRTAVEDPRSLRSWMQAGLRLFLGSRSTRQSAVAASRLTAGWRLARRSAVAGPSPAFVCPQALDGGVRPMREPTTLPPSRKPLTQNIYLTFYGGVQYIVNVRRAFSSVFNFLSGWRSTPGRIPATNQLERFWSPTCCDAPSGRRSP